MSLSVIGLVQRMTQRAWRWSCRSAPTPGMSRMTGMPNWPSSSAGPRPERCMIVGLPYAPAERITSRRARITCSAPPRRKTTPVARPWVTSSRSVNASVMTVRLGRFRAGWR